MLQLWSPHWRLRLHCWRRLDGMLGRTLDRRLGSLQGGLALLSDGPGRRVCQHMERKSGKDTMVMAGFVNVEVVRSKDFRENFFFAGMT